MPRGAQYVVRLVTTAGHAPTGYPPRRHLPKMTNALSAWSRWVRPTAARQNAATSSVCAACSSTLRRRETAPCAGQILTELISPSQVRCRLRRNRWFLRHGFTDASTKNANSSQRGIARGNTRINFAGSHYRLLPLPGASTHIPVTRTMLGLKPG